MHLKPKTLTAIFTFMAFILMTLPSTAQTTNEYNDTELKKFAKVIVEVITIQQESQMQMISLIEEHEMSIKRFNEMMVESQEKPMDQVAGTDDEKEAFADISVQIMEIQEQMEDRLIASIEDEGLTIDKYEQILQDYQQDPELQQRIQSLVE